MASSRTKQVTEWRAQELAAGGASVLAWVPKVWGPEYQEPFHIRPFADMLGRVGLEPVRGLVSVPPRHSKTSTAVAAAVRFLAMFPDKTVCYASYNSDVAESRSRQIRGLAEQAGIRLNKDSTRASRWLTSRGGGLIAAGPASSLTGWGVDAAFLDDMAKNRADAESRAVRENLSDWFRSVLMTRIEPGGSVIVCGTRWSPSDLIGELSRAGGWDCINLPAIDDQGKALWPGRWSLEELDKRRRVVGDFEWSSLYQGQPRPKGGALFNEPTFYDFPNMENAIPVAVCDPAATSGTHSDHSAIVVGLCYRDESGLPAMDVVEVWRGQKPFPQVLAKCKELSTKWGCRVGFELVGGFRAAESMIGRAGVPAYRVQAVKDKFTRALPASAAWNDGRIRVPREAPWADVFINEVCAFTGAGGDAADDQVDALAHAFATFANRPRPRPNNHHRYLDVGLRDPVASDGVDLPLFPNLGR